MHQNVLEGMHADEPSLAGTGISWACGARHACVYLPVVLSRQRSKIIDLLDRESREFASTLGSTSYVSSHSPLRFFK